MRLPSIVILAFLFALPLAAFERGEVYFDHTAASPFNPGSFYEAWVFAPSWSYAVSTGARPLIDKSVPLFGAGHFFIAAPNQIVFHSGGTVSWWDGVPHLFSEPGKGYADIFHDDAPLGEIAPMRNGDYLVPEQSATGAKLIEFNLQGRVAEYAFPNGAGAEHIELLGDQCTLLYGAGNRVARMNLCTGAAMSDFAALPADQMVGSIRQLPNAGDVLVASGSAIVQFSAGGAMLRAYPFDGVTRIALTPDGNGFYAAGVSGEKPVLRVYGAPKDIPIGNPGMNDSATALAADDLVVVGEWRAATQPSKLRLRTVR
jgi:hypothetical protein